MCEKAWKNEGESMRSQGRMESKRKTKDRDGSFNWEGAQAKNALVELRFTTT